VPVASPKTPVIEPAVAELEETRPSD
jgi:hypothetical protein